MTLFTPQSVKWLWRHYKYASDPRNHIHIYNVPSYSYSQDEKDRKVKHHSLKQYTIQPVMGNEEYQVQGSSTYIIKPQLDLAQWNTFPLHLTEMSQEAILPPPAADCGRSRRSTGSCCTNGCLHNSLSATRAQESHAPSALCSPAVTKPPLCF